jgi:hypothetical protein
MAVTWVEKTVTCYKIEWRTKKEEFTVNQVTCKEVVTPVKRTCYEPVFGEQKVKRTVYSMVPRQTTRKVTTCKIVPVTCVDPCTGCTYTRCTSVPVTVDVPCTVFDCVPSEKEFTVRTCSWKPVEQTIQVRHMVPEVKPVKVVRPVSYCVRVPYEVKVKVPVYTPCAPPCPPPCY